MKIILSILSILLLSCTSPKKEIPTGILSEKEFKNVLKDVHLQEAAFEINKRPGSKNTLPNSYHSINKKHNISDTTFSKSLNYYAKNPKKLEKIYTDVLDKLIKERSDLNQQETN